MAKNPQTTWEMLNVAMSHFQEHISQKTYRFALSIIDLLHVSNFKGGNASITEPAVGLSGKLTYYETALATLGDEFAEKSLGQLENDELERLKKLCSDFLDLTKAESSRIRGFGPSYASALLAAHFVDLIPVLDRRALNGAEIATQVDGQGQVKNIATHYGGLINAFHQKLNSDPTKSLRQIDKEWFSKPLPALGSASSVARAAPQRRF